MAGLALGLGTGLISQSTATPATPFTMDQVDGDFSVWFDPSDTEGWTLSGSNVTTALDKSPEENSFVATGTPVLTTAANGAPAVEMRNAVLTGSLGLRDITRQPHIIFVTFELVSNPTTSQRLLINMSGGSGREQLFINSGTSGNDGIQLRYGNPVRDSVITTAGLTAGVHTIMFGFDRSYRRFVRMGTTGEEIYTNHDTAYNDGSAFNIHNSANVDLKILSVVGWRGEISDIDKNRVGNKLAQDTGATWTEIDTAFIRKLPIGLETPTWLTDLLPGFEIMFPSYFHNDGVRATLSGVPSASHSILYSSDHSSGVGYIGRVDFDDFDGTWTDTGDYILSGTNQVETPMAIFDYVEGDRLLMYAHEDVGNGVSAYSDQSSIVYETTDLENFTLIGKIENYSNHSGYARAAWDAGNNRYNISMTYSAAENGIRQRAISSDGLTYTNELFIYPNNAAVLPEGYLLDGSTKVFQYDDGQWYMLGVLMERPRLAPGAEGEAIITFPVDFNTLRPIGGYRVLLEPGTNASNNDDTVLKNYFDYFKIGNEWNLVYGTPPGIMRAKGGINLDATPTTPYIAIESNGEISRPAIETTLMDWDAANDAVPAGLTITAVSGTNDSSQSAGNYYELKAGTTNNEVLRMYPTAAVDISEYDWVEMTFEDLTLDLLTQTASVKKFFMLDAFSSETGFIYSDDDSKFLRFRAMDAGTAAVDKDSYGLPFGTSDGNLARNYRYITRSTPRKFAIGIDLVNEKQFLLLDDCIVYVRDFSADGLTLADVFCGVELNDTASGNAPWIRFSRFTVKAYTGA